jgi:CheY-like chemotaxis protein
MEKGSVPKAKVLIVDDQSQMRAFVRAALKGFPIQMMEAGDGMEAMSLIETEQPDLLLLDYQMPNWDGLTLCYQLRRRPKLGLPTAHAVAKPPKIVLITGESTPASLQEAVNHGVVDAALVKPVDVQELQQLVKKLLALS